ncbi:hypothetical protein GCM10009526_14340 [Glutamicibacter creatinolyticus]
MELAAIATAAVPGLCPVGYAALSDDPEDFDSALLIDDKKNRWRVRSPKHDEASMRLEAELSALRAFSAKVRAALPFALPAIAGTVRQGPLRTFVYKDLPGHGVMLEDLVQLGEPLARELGNTMAAIHKIPDESVEVAGLPTYTADEVRQRKLNELDTAAATGKVPSRLLRRWEHAMEDVSLWRFNAAVVHGSFDEEQLQVLGSRITAVKGWTDLHVGDPAEDFAWLSAVEDHEFGDKVFAAYMQARADKADPHIMRRAALNAEFALAQWLVKSLDSKDDERIADAEQMLHELDENIAEYGGQPLSVVEEPRPVSSVFGKPQQEQDPTNEQGSTAHGEDSNTASAPDSSQRVSKLPERAQAQPAGADEAAKDEAAKDEAAKDETETGREADQQETVAPETGGTHTGSTAAKQPPAPEQDSTN